LTMRVLPGSISKAFSSRPPPRRPRRAPPGRPRGRWPPGLINARRQPGLDHADASPGAELEVHRADRLPSSAKAADRPAEGSKDAPAGDRRVRPPDCGRDGPAGGRVVPRSRPGGPRRVGSPKLGRDSGPRPRDMGGNVSARRGITEDEPARRARRLGLPREDRRSSQANRGRQGDDRGQAKAFHVGPPLFQISVDPDQAVGIRLGKRRRKAIRPPTPMPKSAIEVGSGMARVSDVCEYDALPFTAVFGVLSTSNIEVAPPK